MYASVRRMHIIFNTGESVLPLQEGQPCRKSIERNSAVMRKEVLMTPGPSQVPPQVAAAGAVPMMHHRSGDFKKIFARVVEGMKKIFGTQGDVFVLSSSGTGAMEAAVVNMLSPGDRVIVANTGKFGERFTNLCKNYGVDVVEIVKEWGDIVTPADIAEALEREQDIKAVFVTYSETSTGIANPVKDIAAVVDNAGALFIVDAVSALGGLEMKMDEWKIDVVAAGSQKALMMAPGLGFIAIRGEKAWKAYEQSTIKKFYFDIGKYRKIFNKSGDTPFTTAVSLTLNLEESIKMIIGEGLDNVYERHAKMARATVAGIKAMGLKLFSQNGSNVLTVFSVPEGIDGNELVKVIREKYGIRASGGQEPFKGKIVRIAHMGYVTSHDVILALSAVEMALADMGFKVEPGSAVRAAQEEFRK